MNRLHCISFLLLAALSLCCATAFAQNKGKGGGGSKPSGPSSSGSGKSKGGGSSSGGASSPSGSSASSSSGDSAPSGPFSIETEMFTYKAVEHNSAVIACDTAQYLFHGEVADAPAGSHAPCAITGASARPGIILISADSTLLSDFQLWRADMIAMQSLVARAHASCVANPEKSGHEEEKEKPQMGGRGLLGDALGGMANPAEAASVAGDVLKMFSSDQSVTSVVGTVQDPALMNEVARHLRALNVQVLIPELYPVNALGAIDSAHSPYRQTLQEVSNAYDQCSEAKAGYSAESRHGTEIEAVTTSIKDFLSSALAASSQATDAGAQTTTHVASILAADELAKRIGFTATGGPDPNSPWHDVLWVKALESGGSVTKKSSLLGSKVFFGGGAVDTYSVFNLTGDLVCAGNVYSFQQPVNLKDVDKAVRAHDPDSPAKWESEHSTCAPLNGN